MSKDTDQDPAVLLNESDQEKLLSLVSEATDIPIGRLQEIKNTRGIPTGEETLKLLKAFTGEDPEGFLQACGLRD